MKRRLLLACLFVSVAASAGPLAQSSSRQQESTWPPTALEGDWRLVGETADEVNLPSHGMDLRFSFNNRELSCVVLSRVTGEPTRTLPEVSFDGRVLRYRLGLVTEDGQTMPEMVMQVAGSVLLGQWHEGGAPIGPTLKLVRKPGS